MKNEEQLAAMSANKVAYNNSWKKVGNPLKDKPEAFIGSIDESDLSFRTSNQECMRMDKKGNIGIGTQAPKSKLHVVGTTKLAAPSAAVPTESSETSKLAVDIQQAGENTYALRMQRAGKATELVGGIGWSGDSAYLGTKTYHDFRLMAGNGGAIAIKGATVTNAAGQESNVKLRNVGIGTFEPEAKLHILKDKATEILKLEGLPEKTAAPRQVVADEYGNIGYIKSNPLPLPEDYTSIFKASLGESTETETKFEKILIPNHRIPVIGGTILIECTQQSVDLSLLYHHTKIEYSKLGKSVLFTGVVAARKSAAPSDFISAYYDGTHTKWLSPQEAPHHTSFRFFFGIDHNNHFKVFFERADSRLGPLNVSASIR